MTPPSSSSTAHSPRSTSTLFSLYSQFALNSVIFTHSLICSIRHLSTVEDPLIRAKWMNVKKALSEETEVVKQLDAERRAFKDNPIGRRPSSPPISVKSSSSFVFQPLDEYPTSSSGPGPVDDPDVWRPPSRDTTSRRPARPGQVGARKSAQDGAWARGATARTGAAGRGAKAGATGRVNSGTRASTTTGKKGGAASSGKASKTDTAAAAVTVSFSFDETVWLFLRMVY